MNEEKDSSKKSTVDSFAKMFKEFGNAISEIFNDPDFKKKAKEFGESAVESAKALAERFKDEDVKNKFKDVGRAAQEFGKNISDSFRDDKSKEEDKNQNNTKAHEKTKKAEDGIEDTNLEKKIDDYFKNTRGGRITGYAVSIFWSLAFIIFLNFYYDYIAIYYDYGRTPILTGEWRAFLPIMTIAFAASIVGNVILIIYDRYELMQIINIITNVLGIAAVVTLLYLFPFDFSVIPHRGLSLALTPIVTVFLILLAVGLAVGVLVRFIKLTINILKQS